MLTGSGRPLSRPAGGAQPQPPPGDGHAGDDEAAAISNGAPVRSWPIGRHRLRRPAASVAASPFPAPPSARPCPPERTAVGDSVVGDLGRRGSSSAAPRRHIDLGDEADTVDGEDELGSGPAPSRSRSTRTRCAIAAVTSSTSASIAAPSLATPPVSSARLGRWRRSRCRDRRRRGAACRLRSSDVGQLPQRGSFADRPPQHEDEVAIGPRRRRRGAPRRRARDDSTARRPGHRRSSRRCGRCWRPGRGRRRSASRSGSTGRSPSRRPRCGRARPMPPGRCRRPRAGPSVHRRSRGRRRCRSGRPASTDSMLASSSSIIAGSMSAVANCRGTTTSIEHRGVRRRRRRRRPRAALPVVVRQPPVRA